MLCPVDGVALLDHALARVAPLVSEVAVNARYGVEQIVEHVAGRAHVSDERSFPEELGTAGAIGALREWLDGRAALVVNGDTWTDVDVAPLVDGWDGERVRVLVHDGDLVPGARIVASLVPAADVARLPATPLGLSNGLWWPALADGRLESISGAGRFVSCDRPRDYLLANLLASGGRSVVGVGAVVEGTIERCVVWPGARVRADEVLVDAIRCDDGTTVLVRQR
ncbi:MAG: N-acetyl-alpha-D-muramate 1-phosphate uridylyltransferase [Actinomycetota bacterium]|nr:N-acetyl-alpha-D-muramate 1-phosphate uridylyltransferase [Actinomycetota bacterium]